MTTKTASLDDALHASEQLSPADRLRLISLLSERLSGEIDQSQTPVDMLSLAGLGQELWRGVDVDAYLDQERASWET